MTPRDFCTSGQAEPLKGAVHATVGTLLAVMATYNAVAFVYRRDRHLAGNALLYAAGAALEAYQTSRHWSR